MTGGLLRVPVAAEPYAFTDVPAISRRSPVSAVSVVRGRRLLNDGGAQHYRTIPDYTWTSFGRCGGTVV